MKQVPEFMRDADNVYRTRDYIVKQKLILECNLRENNETVSCDVYYKRTVRRDKEYEAIFYDRKYINGKRLPATMHTRRYVN